MDDIFSNINDFLSKSHHSTRKIYIIDADNDLSNIREILEDEDTELVICVASSQNILTGLHNKVGTRYNNIIIHSVFPGKDSSDVFISSILGWLIAKCKKFYGYIIVSNDKIFEALAKEYRRLGYDVKII